MQFCKFFLNFIILPEDSGHVRIFNVKKFLFIPFVFTINFILTFLLIGGFTYLYFQVTRFSIISETSVLTQQFMFILHTTYLPTLFISTFLTFIFINRKKAPFLPSILLVCGIFAVFMMLVYPLLKTGSWKNETAIVSLEEKKILEYERFSVFLNESKDQDLENLIIYNDPDSNMPWMKYKRYAFIEDNALTGSGDSYQIYQTSQLSNAALGPPETISGIARDSLALSDNLNRFKEKNFTMFLLVIGVFTLFVLSNFMISRMTRWPLLNYLLIFLSLRLFFFLQSFLTNPTAIEIYREIGLNADILVILLLAFLILCVVLTVIFLIFRIPSKEKGAVYE